MGFFRRFWWAVLIALAIVWLPFMNEIAKRAFPPAPEAPGAVDMGPEIDALRDEVARLSARLDALNGDIAEERARGAARDAEIARLYEGGAQTGGEAPPKPEDRFATKMLLTGRRNVNDPLKVIGATYMETVFGPPRLARDFSDECQAPDNPRLVANLALEDVGPFRARMLRPALASLRRIFAAVKEFEPELYAVIGSSGSLCGRLIRGSKDRISAHAYGTAIDITIDGRLDDFGDGSSQLGLILLSEYFLEEGWYWGAAFSREDSMHFEVSRSTLDQWRANGEIDETVPMEASR